MLQKKKRTLSRSNLLSMREGMRRSASDGDLTIETKVLAPRKRRSHNFGSQVIEPHTLDNQVGYLKHMLNYVYPHR